MWYQCHSAPIFTGNSLRFVKTATVGQHMLPRQPSQHLGKHEIQVLLCERKDSEKFLRALTQWVGWLDPAPKPIEYYHTFEFLDGSLVFSNFFGASF